jgi:uncharacterized protein
MTSIARGRLRRKNEENVMFRYRDKTALITGASSGIGESFARVLAARGMHLILVARSEERLHMLSDELSRHYGIKAYVIATDLSQPGAAKCVKAAVQERSLTVHLLVNNAGFAVYDHFEKIDPERDHQQVMVNVSAVVDLAHAFLPDMVARGEGAVINVSSRGAFQPGAYFAVYAASKAFVLSFSEALWAEFRERGIDVLALCPGPVDTNFFNVVGRERRGLEAKASPESIVVVALKALEQRKSFVIPEWRIWLSSQIMSRLLPRAFVARTLERLTRPEI